MTIQSCSRELAAEVRALLRFMLQHGDVVGTDHAGRTVLQLAVDPVTLDQLLGDAQDPESSAIEPPQVDGPPVLDFVPARRLERERAGCGDPQRRRPSGLGRR